MSTIEKIEQLVEIAKKLGYRVRYDYSGGTGGGVCEFSGNKWIFVDLALTSVEQLERLRSLLVHEPLFSRVQNSEPVLSDSTEEAA